MAAGVLAKEIREALTTAWGRTALVEAPQYQPGDTGYTRRRFGCRSLGREFDSRHVQPKEAPMPMQLLDDPVTQDGTTTLDLVWALPTTLTEGPGGPPANTDTVALHVTRKAYPQGVLTVIPRTETAVYDAVLARVNAAIYVANVDYDGMCVAYTLADGVLHTACLRVVRVCLPNAVALLPAVPFRFASVMGFNAADAQRAEQR